LSALDGLDVNGDGVINTTDTIAFHNRFGTILR